jgi:virginiamycin B lyase
MKSRLNALVPAALALFGASPLNAAPPDDTVLQETIIEVPDFADFLVVDGDAVWATNSGRIEKWSTAGKLAEVAIPRPCGTMALAAGSLWVGNCQGGELYRVDPATAQVIAQIPAGIGPSGEQNVVSGAGSIWAPNQADGTVSRIDPSTNSIVATVKVAPDTTYLAYGFDALWAASGKGGTMQRIDPETNMVTDTIELGKTPGFLAAGEGMVWIQEQGDGTLARIDPETRTVTGRTRIGDHLKWGDIDTGEGKVFLRTTDDQTFVVVDAETAAVVARVGRPEGSGALRYTPDGIWTSAHDVHTLTWWSPHSASK